MRIRILMFVLLFCGLAAAQSIELQHGWNLVSIPGEGELGLGTCGVTPVGVLYIPYVNKFMTVPEVLQDMDNYNAFFASHAFWVYSYQECELEFVETRKTSYGELWLDEGWSFVPVTEDMAGKTWDGIGAGCGIKSVYTWGGKWEKFDGGEIIRENLIGKGFLIRANSCRLA